MRAVKVNQNCFGAPKPKQKAERCGTVLAKTKTNTFHLNLRGPNSLTMNSMLQYFLPMNRASIQTVTLGTCVYCFSTVCPAGVCVILFCLTLGNESGWWCCGSGRLQASEHQTMGGDLLHHRRWKDCKPQACHQNTYREPVKPVVSKMLQCPILKQKDSILVTKDYHKKKKKSRHFLYLQFFFFFFRLWTMLIYFLLQEGHSYQDPVLLSEERNQSSH